MAAMAAAAAAAPPRGLLLLACREPLDAAQVTVDFS
jgi:hypothetical protein